MFKHVMLETQDLVDIDMTKLESIEYVRNAQGLTGAALRMASGKIHHITQESVIDLLHTLEDYGRLVA